MEFRILGPLQVLRDGHPLVLGGPRQRAVLARLLLDAGRVVHADTLIEDVWAGTPPATAAKTLQKHVSALRKVLGRATVRTTGGGYAVDLAEQSLDAQRFEEHVTAGEFAEALSLWRGEVLSDLPDVGFATPQRVRLDELRLVALEGCLSHELDGGRHAELVGELEVLVAEHPLRERLVALHMLALYRSGRQVEAMRAYERHRRRLAEEVGLEPAAALRTLETAILRQDPDLDLAVSSAGAATARRAEVGEPSPVRLPRAALRHADRVFVGREAELAALREAWKAAVGGSRGLVVLGGEAGAGKTRLVSHFAAEAHRDGAVVLWGRATEGPILSYEPIVAALRTVLRTVSLEAQRRVVDGRPALGLLVPDLDTIVPGSEVTRPELGMERFVIYETVAELLESESDEWPLLFVLDDLQWADELSLQLIDHVMRHDRSARLLLVGTMRSLPAVPAPAVDDFLAAAQRDGMLTRVDLTGLDVPEVATLLRESGWVDAQAAAEPIHRATDGNALFVTELADAGPAESPVALPASLREVLRSRLDRLDADTSRLVAVAAVAGRALSLPVLMAVSDLVVGKLFDAIDDALAAGILVEDATSGGIAFRHALVRQAALEQISGSRQAALHLALGRAMASSGQPAAERAHHLLAAGDLAPMDEVVDAAVLAARDALDVLAYEDALRCAAHALDAAGSSRDGDSAEPLELEALLVRSDALRALGRRSEARDAAREAAELARGSADPVLLARAAEAVALARAGIGFDFGTYDPDLESLLQEALEALPPTDVDYRARLIGASLASAAAKGDTNRVTRLGSVATQLGATKDQPALLATAQLAWRMASWRRDYLDERIEADSQARANATRAGSLALELNALLYGITDLLEAGRLDESDEWFERFRARAARLHQPVYDAYAHSTEAMRLLMRGEYEASARLADEALAVGNESHGETGVQAWMANHLVRAWDHGELSGLVDATERALGQFTSQPTWRIIHGTVLAAAGDRDGAQSVLTDVIGDDAIATYDDSLWGIGAGLLVEIARTVGDTGRAAVMRRVLSPYVDRWVVGGLARVTLGPVARYAGVAAHVAGDLDDAVALLAVAERRCRDAGARPHLARTLYDRSCVHTDRGAAGDSTAAGTAIEEARVIAGEIGLVLGDLSALP